MLYGAMGMPYRELREYIDLYLQEYYPDPLWRLVEQFIGRTGFGKLLAPAKLSKGVLHTAQAWVGDDTVRGGVPKIVGEGEWLMGGGGQSKIESFAEVSWRAVPGDSIVRAELRQPKCYGKGPMPC